MILQIFVLVLLLLLVLFALNIKTCGKDKQFLFKGKCVKKCNPGMVLDEFNRCVYSCPDHLILNEKSTISRCAKCQQGLVAYKNECLTKCPEDTKAIDIRKDGLVCVKECPEFKRSVVDKMDGNTYCIPNCDTDSLYDPVTLTCVKKCTEYAPYESAKDGVKICDNMCPSYYTADNKCVDVCVPELVKFYNNKAYCGDCPSGTSISASNPYQCVANV